MIRTYQLESDCPFDCGSLEVWKDDEDGDIYYSPADIPNHYKKFTLEGGEVVYASPYSDPWMF